MNANKYTQKSLEAIQEAQAVATEYGNQQIEQPHLLLALLETENGLIPQLLTKMGLTAPSFAAAVKNEVQKLPRVWFRFPLPHCQAHSVLPRTPFSPPLKIPEERKMRTADHPDVRRIQTPHLRPRYCP